MSADLAASCPSSVCAYLGHPSTHAYLKRFVQRRVPASEVADVVQTVLCDALAAEGTPHEPGAFRRWITTIARRRVIDWYRSPRQHLEIPLEEEPGAAGADHETASLARWLVAQTPAGAESDRALDWLRRSAEGEKFEDIAAVEALPPPLVRKRVSRLRQWLRTRWHAELAAAALLGCVGLTLLAVHAWPSTPEPLVVTQEGVPLAPATVRAALGGLYVLEQAAPGPDLDPVRSGMVRAQLGKLRILVSGTRLEARSPDLSLGGTLRVSLEDGGAFLVMVDFGDQRSSFRCVPDGPERLRLESLTAPWQGELVLRRLP